MKALKISLTTIIVIILLIIGLLFGLKVYGDHHPNNKDVKSLNMSNPFEPTKEYYVKRLNQWNIPLRIMKMKATSIKQLAMMIMVIVKNHIYGNEKT